MTKIAIANSAYRRGLQAYREGRLQDAQVHYREAIEANLRHAESLYMLAVMADQVGNAGAAARLAARALEAGGESAVVRTFLGSVLLKKGHVPAARDALLAASRLPTSNPHLLLALGFGLRDCGEHKHAEESWRRATRLEPALHAAHNALGGVLLERGELEEALAEVEAALAGAPLFVAAAYNRREALRRLGKTTDPCATERADRGPRVLRCAIVTPVGPGHSKLVEECGRSVESAFAADPGPFAEVRHIRIDDGKGMLGRSRARNEGTRQAVAAGADYVFFLDADDVMAVDAFKIVAPFLPEHDGVWGAISSFRGEPKDAIVRADQLWCSTSLSDVLFLPPVLTLQMGHFMGASTASRYPFDESIDVGEDFDYYLRVWEMSRCLKVPQPLFHNRRGMHSVGPRSATGRQWNVAVEARIKEWFRGRTAPCSFECYGRTVTFQIANPQDLIQRHFIAGTFFEAEELRFLRDQVPPGARIVDVGANVGNHAIFFGLYMQPSSLLLIEPNPEAVALLEANLRANGLDRSNGKIRDVGVASRQGRHRVVARQPNNLGASALVPADGEQGIAVQPLDQLVDGPVDLLKIDVEGMEMDVLESGRELIATHRPSMMVEIANANAERFRSYLSTMNYEVQRRFDYVNASNLFVIPRR